MDQTWSYTIDGAEALLLKFTSGSVTESSFDTIYVMDGNGKVIGSYSGTSMAGKVIKITGDTVNIRLKTDSSFSYYGFRFDYIVPCAE
jgi:hypothetical protein